MKKILVVLILLYTNRAYSQNHKKIVIPLLKENHKIDSLLDTVISRTSSHPTYFSFETTNLGDEYLFSISQLRNNHSNIYYVFMTPKYMKNFGYFKYKGCTVFVSGGIDPYGFFKITRGKKSFDFIPNNKSNNIDDLFFGFYTYDHGRFLVDDIKVE